MFSAYIFPVNISDISGFFGIVKFFAGEFLLV